MPPPSPFPRPGRARRVAGYAALGSVAVALGAVLLRGELAPSWLRAVADAATAPLQDAGPPSPAVLIPVPREYEPLPPLALGGTVAVTASAEEDSLAVRELSEALSDRGVRVGSRLGAGTNVRLLRSGSAEGEAALRDAGLTLEPAMEAEGYALITRRGGADVVAASGAGIFYGAQTLRQLLSGSGEEAVLLGARIRDWPVLRWRGLHDDLSRGPVPTLDFQKAQIRTFAAHKLNVYSPYFEHTLEYESHPLIAPPGGAMTQAQVRELVEYARRYHVTVVPEQEAFGHLHHVLKYEIYRDVAETPHGHVLAPGAEGSLALIRDWFGEIDRLFPGPFVHLGADETFELGRGRTREAVEALGLGRVYLDFLTRIVGALEPTDKRFLFWGDVAMNEPALVSELPPGLVAVAWNYWDADGFERYLDPFRRVGMETWVAPGVNNWNRIYPDFATALPNIRGFIATGQRLGSTGALNTTWDDDGEALFNQTWYGVVLGAAAAWQEGPVDLDAYASRFGDAFHGDPTGAVAEGYRLLTEAYRVLNGAEIGLGSDALFWMDPWSPEGRRVTAAILPVADSLRLLSERALVRFAEARRAASAREETLRHPDALLAMEVGARKMDFLGMKFQFAEEVAEMYDRAAAVGALRTRVRGTEERRAVIDELRDISAINGRLQDLRDGYALIRQLYEDAWLRENRPYWIHNVLARYDRAIGLWTGRIDGFYSVWSHWNREGTIPSAGEAGIPEPVR